MNSGREKEMRNAFLALAAVGAVVGLQQAAKRMHQKTREHCREMGAQYGSHQHAVRPQ